MITCPNCGKENPDDRTSCKFCGFTLYAASRELDLDDLLAKIKDLEAQLTNKDGELQTLREENKSLEAQLAEKKGDSKGPVEHHPEVHNLRQAVESKQKQLDDKETHVQWLMKEIEKLRRLIPVPRAHPGAQIAIDTYPVVQSPFHMVLDHATDSIDLAATKFRIRASLERSSDGIQIVAHDGADINVRPSQKGFKWTRLKGGDKFPVESGTIFFDSTTKVGARLSLLN